MATKIQQAWLLGKTAGRNGGPRFRRLKDGMKRAIRLVIVSLCLPSTAQPVLAQLKSFPWFNRSDPKITTRVFTRNPGFRLSCKDVGVFPFSVSELSESASADLSTYVRQALLAQGVAETIAHISTAPWNEVPAWKARKLSENDKLRAIGADAAGRGLELAVVGRLGAAFRKPSKGLSVRATVWVIRARDGEIVWYGTKHADWIRYFPLEECLYHLAWSFVLDWGGSGA